MPAHPAAVATQLTGHITPSHLLQRDLDRVPSERFFRLTNKFYDVPAASVYDPAFRTLSLELAERVLRGYYEESKLGGDLMNSMLYVDSKIKLADHILTKVDLMSMKVGLEVRSPFLDYRVVEAAFR